MKKDAINPAHYKDNPHGETINLIRSQLSPEEFKGYLRGNSLKYRLRAGLKSDKIEEDIKKAMWYESKYIDICNTEA